MDRAYYHYMYTMNEAVMEQFYYSLTVQHQVESVRKQTYKG